MNTTSRLIKTALGPEVTAARQAAVAVLLHNARGPAPGRPRTAGWGYPEPYTRDLMLSALGSLVSGQAELTESLRRVLVTLARHQTPRGHLPGLSAVTDVFAQPREHTVDARSGHRPRGAQHVVEGLPGHETRHGAPHERRLRAVLAKPGIVGHLQEERARKTHRC